MKGVAVTVQELTCALKSQLTQLGVQQRVRCVIGRITTAPSGHAYFEISDEETNARISCVMWAPCVAPKKAGLYEVIPVRVDFYAPQGRAQLVVRECCPLDTTVETTKKARALATLHNEGLTNRPRLCIPDTVEHVCIVTSHDSAAAHDMLKSIDERWAGLRTTLVHSTVQGADAPESLVRALMIANSLSPAADVIICGRGGGSEADLMAFDDEQVARALAACPVPTVSAVGHETDHSVTDAVADVRAKTPTGAIELVIPVSKSVRVTELVELRDRLASACEGACIRCGLIRKAGRERLFGATMRLISNEEQRVSSLRATLNAMVDGAVTLAKTRVCAHRTELTRLVQREYDARRQGHAALRRACDVGVSMWIDREASRLRAYRKDLDAHGVTVAWKRGFFTLSRATSSSHRVRNLNDIYEGEDLCVRSHDYMIHVTVRKCQKVR